MIPRLHELYNRVVQNMLDQRITDQKLNAKRKTPNGVNFDNDEDEELKVEMNSRVLKKVKTAPEDKATSSTREAPPQPFFIKLICDPEIKECLPRENELKIITPTVKQDGNSELTFKREEFAKLPLDTCLRLSKEHASIQARSENNKTVYELKDLSVNGTFLLGNSIEGNFENPPQRLSKRQNYQLKHGDRIGLLMKKEEQQKVLLGFEFFERRSF